jgi:hypothetical protein
MNPSTRHHVRVERRVSLRARRLAALTIAALSLTAGEARAQQGAGSFTGFLTGHAGAVTGGDLSAARGNLGLSVAVHEDSGWGAEIDFGHASDATVGPQLLDVTSYMVNAIWLRPAGLIRPFGVAGAGILQINGCDATCSRTARTYDFGLNAGAGAFVLLNDVAALRADARYFFSSADHPDLSRPSNFNYWRITIGATFIWAMAP